MSQTPPPDTTPADEEEMAHSRSCPGCVLCREPDTPPDTTWVDTIFSDYMLRVLQLANEDNVDDGSIIKLGKEAKDEAKTRILAHETQAVREAIQELRNQAEVIEGRDYISDKEFDEYLKKQLESGEKL